MTENELKVTDKRVARTIEPEFKAPVTSQNQIMMEAVRKGFGKEQLEVLKGMFELQREAKKEEAKELFFEDFAKFKQEEITVLTDKINKSFEGHRYPSIGNFLSTVNPHLGRHNLSANFRIEEPDDLRFIRVVAVISHNKGHSIEAGMSAGPDTKGPKGADVKTEIHGRMSTVTHLMRTTFSLVTGIGAIDPQFDDDGNAAGKSNDRPINIDQQTVINDRIKEIYTDSGKLFLKWLKVGSVEEIPSSLYDTAINGLNKAEAKKKEALKREPGSDDQ